MSNQPAVTARQKILFLVGAVLAVAGSFLPWEVWGDFVPHWRYGVQLYPAFVDNGGLIIILLSASVIGLAFHTLAFVKQPATWIKVSAGGLVIISIYHIMGWLQRRIEANGVIGAPELKIGLVMVLIGSLLMFLTGLWSRQFEKAAIAE